MVGFACSVCGYHGTFAARFCPQCGTPLSKAYAPEQLGQSQPPTRYQHTGPVIHDGSTLDFHSPAPHVSPSPAEQPTIEHLPPMPNSPSPAEQATIEHLPPTSSAHPETLAPFNPPTEPVRPADWPTIPGYEVVKLLGKGGMGVVYLAEQRQLNRRVALKMMLSTEDELALARFRLEGKAVARLQHPNIVQIFEVGEHEGKPFLAMEFVAGGSLDRVLDDRPQPPEQAARLVCTLALAMHEAHRKGIVHRDLKPANVLLSYPAGPSGDRPPLSEYIPKITDFGLAKDLTAGRGLTMTADVMGTPAYMAPEQAEGRLELMGPGTDVYALGAILYQLLVGSPPFQGNTVYDTVLKVIHEDPVSPRQHRTACPKDLETITLKCLEKHPNRRYTSARELADELQRYLSGQPILARQVGVGERLLKWARRNPVVASLSATLALVFVVSFVIITWKWREATELAIEKTQEHQRAEENRRRAEQNLEYAREAVDRMLTRVGSETFKDEPRMEQLRRDLLEEAGKLQERILQSEGEDANLRSDAGRAWTKLGEIRRYLDQFPEALAAYERGESLLRPIVAELPGRLDCRLLLASCRAGKADVLREQGELAAAEAVYRQVLTECQALAQAGVDTQLQQAQIAGNLALVRWRQGDSAEADRLLDVAISSLQQPLTKERDRDRDRDRDEVRSYQLYRLLYLQGSIQSALEQFEAARLSLTSARDGLTHLVARSPRRSDLRTELALTCRDLAALQRDRAPDQARINYKLALDYTQKLRHDFPTVGEYARLSASILQEWTILELAAGRTAVANQLVDRALELRDQLPRLTRVPPEFRLLLADGLARKATVAQVARQLDQVEALYCEAVQLLDEGIEQTPQDNRLLRVRAEQLGNWAVMLAQSGRLTDAMSRLRESVNDWERLAKLSNALPSDSKALANALQQMGTFAQLSGRAVEAESAYRQALTQLRRIADDNPDDPDSRFRLAIGQYNLALHLWRYSPPHERPRALAQSAKLWRDSADELDELAKRLPNVPQYRQQQARALFELGNALASSKQADEAVEVWKQAYQLRQTLLAGDKINPLLQQELAASEMNLGKLYARSQPVIAEQYFRRACDLLESARQSLPAEPTIERDLITAHSLQATLLQATDPDNPRLLRSAERLVQLWECKANAEPDNPTARAESARARQLVESLRNR